MNTCRLLIISFIANLAFLINLALFLGGGALLIFGYEPIKPHLLTLIVIIFVLYLFPELYSDWLVEKLGIGDKRARINNSFTIFFKHLSYCRSKKA